MKKLTIKLFVIFVLLSLFIGCSLEQRRYFVRTIPFDEKKWKINDAEMCWDLRPGMAGDLIERKLLLGKSCAEINDLPNIYEHIVCDKNSSQFELKEFYSSDIDRSSAAFLKIYFDENKKVEKAEIKFYNTGDWTA